MIVEPGVVLASFFSNALVAVLALMALWAVVWIPVGILVARGFGWPAGIGAAICFVGGPIGLIAFLVIAVAFRAMGKEPPTGRPRRSEPGASDGAADLTVEDLSL